MSIDQIIQIMRTASIAEVRALLEHAGTYNPDMFNQVANFYKEIAIRRDK